MRTLGIAGILMLLILISSCAPPFFQETGASLPGATESPSPGPTASPSPASMSSAEILFTQSDEYPLPGELERLPLAGPRFIGGMVEASAPLTEIRLRATCARNDDPFYPYEQTVHFLPSWDVRSYDFCSVNTMEGASLASLFPLSDLKTGIHTLSVSAKTQLDNAPRELFTVKFYMLDGQWQTIASKDFGNNGYASAYAFFQGDSKRFLYSYQVVWDRYLVADPDWENTYITDFNGIGEDPWRIHRDALDYYAMAGYFIHNVRLRVHGANGDTGVIPLSKLIVSYNGSYVSRFTSGLKVISHHAFGTATDLNASIAPNKNSPDNNALIDSEVGSMTQYNGILQDGTGPYYDFSYLGEYACTDFGVPESIINYLLYELAFFRAGFQWGHYYTSTSDAMHFVLTENIRTGHDDEAGLRKVYEYSE